MANKQEKVPGLRVTTKKEGFRRGGREWSGTTELPISELTEKQLNEIKSEPRLIVDEIDMDIA